MLDVFRTDAFSAVSLTASYLKQPYKPAHIGELGLFRSYGITTTTAVVEEQIGVLTLIETSPRGGPASSIGREARKVRSFAVPHLERESRVTADDVQNVRAFGSDNAMEAIQTVIDQRLARLRQMHEATLEYHRVGAIKGLIYEPDGATAVYNLFTEFGVTQQTLDLDFTAENLRSQIVAAQRLSEDELGAEMVSGYRAFCGDDFFDDFVDCDMVKETLKYQEGRILREDLRKGFDFGGVTWENYRGKVGGISFFPGSEAYLVPVGTDIFHTAYAPADFLEAVNTVGLPGYAKVAEGELNRWAKVHTQSNPFCVCTRPRAVIRLTKST